MEVKIKDLGIELEVKSKGIEFGVRDNSGAHLGDLYLTSTRMIWCNGRTHKENGIEIDWEDFIEMMNNRTR